MQQEREVGYLEASIAVLSGVNGRVNIDELTNKVIAFKPDSNLGFQASKLIINEDLTAYIRRNLLQGGGETSLVKYENMNSQGERIVSYEFKE